ncbi:proline-rich receptor-like protein kinase perk12 [Quercus suber]|uniref:Proline-rich receptor-like protein kinase perk12 n=1 Tax=Quercus suber TaxID=58331 RepID=A0AAW0KKT1_QUESU
MKVYHGFLQDIPVLVKCFLKTDERFWSTLKILSRVRHRHIRNIFGYCCADDSVFLLCDCSCMDTVEVNLQCDDLAKVFGWNQGEIGGSLRYLHEECIDGPIVHLSVCSAHVVNTQGNSAMATSQLLSGFTDKMSPKEDSPAESQNLEEDGHRYVDVHDYGMFLLELITGKSARCFQAEGKGQPLVNWATPLLKNGSLSELMDHRLTDTSDMEVVNHMANAALCCLKSVKGRRLSMSEVRYIIYALNIVVLRKVPISIGCYVLAVVRGDELALSKYGFSE